MKISSLATDIAIWLVGAALLVFLTASFNRTITEFSSTAGKGATIEIRTP